MVESIEKNVKGKCPDVVIGTVNKRFLCYSVCFMFKLCI